MAANVTEKDKALQEVIAWCDSRFDKACQYFSAASSGELAAQYLVAIYAYRGVIAHCRSMLGSGSMPSEVPNQSEAADQAQCGYASCITYDDWDDSSPDMQPQVGDYGVAVRETYDGQEEIPFHIEREERTGLLVALLNDGLYAKPEDDIDDGRYASLFQLYLDGYMLTRTGRKRNKDTEE